MLVFYENQLNVLPTSVLSLVHLYVNRNN